MERDIITILLKQENHNQSKVAKRLGISRSTLWRKLKNDL
ncbi:helix-turn-helix domain-containing protein [Eubacterium callanderi]